MKTAAARYSALTVCNVRWVKAFLGKAGVGKMSTGTMSAEEVFSLKTGNLHLDGDQLNDNYDWALYRDTSPVTCTDLFPH